MKEVEFYSLILFNQLYLQIVDTFYMGLESTVQLEEVDLFLSM